MAKGFRDSKGNFRPTGNNVKSVKTTGFRVGDRVKVDGRKGRIVGGSAGHPAVEFDDGGEARNVFVEAVEKA